MKTTQEQFEGLHDAVAKVRTSSTTVKVDRQALVHLLMDHAKFTPLARTQEASNAKS